ncbi:hypothetical protein [Actinoplanes sp. NPDC049802]|uniref:hypothetical protein n=1 Tax=Actinoplanes sp. NPDC049802 TaxID=3154742 RepID=UPI0033E00703
MSSKGIAIDRPRRLPIQVPLRPGETPESFVRRLAIANHLRPSYLRSYLTDPPGPLGAIQLWRLAAVTDRTEAELMRVMPGLQPAPTRTPQPRRRKDVDLPTAIRRAAGIDADVQRLSKHFGLPRPTIIKALTSQVPATERSAARFSHQRPHRNPILDDVADYLDQLIAEHPDASIWSIWKKLIQERHTTAGYGTVRDYINRVRADPTDAGSARHLLSRAALFDKIRDAADGQDLISRLAAQFSTDPAAVAQALADGPAKLPKTKKSRRNPILEDLRHHIDDMITTDPGITVATIWERLVDEHNAAVSYGTVRDYVSRERRQSRPRSKPTLSPIPADGESLSGAPALRQAEVNATAGQLR